MTEPSKIRMKNFPENITITMPSGTEQEKQEAEFIFGPPDTRPDSRGRLNVAERFAWVGGCLTRFAAFSYVGDMTEARRRLEAVNAGEIKPFLRDPQKWRVFDLPPPAERQVPLEEANHPGLHPSFMAEAGHVMYNIGNQFQSFVKLSDTEVSESTASHADSYVTDKFSRSHSSVPGATQRCADKVALTLITSQATNLEPHYAARVAFSGNGHDVKAQFSYSANLAQSKGDPSQLAVSGNMLYGVDDFRFVNVELVSLAIAGMRMEHMEMNV